MTRRALLPTPTKPLPFGEFVALVSMLTALVALAIDAAMPALPAIGLSLGVAEENQRQLVIAAVFLGMGVGQLLYGPLADSRGRRVAIALGLVVFLVGAVMAWAAQSFEFLLAGRLVQGLGIAAARSIPMALVRDGFEGEAMARVMSFTQSIFILIPMLAPAYGQMILALAGWREIFASFLVVGAALLAWFWLRQPETLTAANRRPVTAAGVWASAREMLQSRAALGYTLVSGLVSGAFLGYLNSAQQLYQDMYGVGDQFALYFAIVALSVGVASLLNTRLVGLFGIQRICRAALWGVVALALGGLAYAYAYGGQPPFAGFIAYLMLSFFCVGLLFGNLNALAMQPLGRAAGVGASLVGGISMLLSVPLGTAIGLAFNSTTYPLMLGLAVLCAASLGLMHWAERGAEGATLPA